MSTATATPKIDLKAAFDSAGYDVFSFTPAEQSAISAKIQKLRDEGKPQRQAIAIAISMVTPGKAKKQSTATAAFSASNDGAPGPKPKIKLRGGSYAWHDDGDGYFTIFDVPIMSIVKKGVKGAPMDVDEAELNRYVQVAQERYHHWNYCATAFVNHNKDVEFEKPEFAGYVLPYRVGPAALEDETGVMRTVPAVFANLKVNESTFRKIERGELPYHSPEVPWAKRRISGLAFLDTKPPFFEFPNLTLGDEQKDLTYADSATFSEVPVKDIKREPVGRFDADGDGDGGVKQMLKNLDAKMSAMEAKYAAFEGQFAAMKKKFEGEAGDLSGTKVASTGGNGSNPPTNPAGGTSTPVLKGKAEGEGDGDADGEAGKKGKKGTFAGEKGNPLPVEPTTPVVDPKFVAQFEATNARLAVLEKERADEKAAVTKKDRVAWARKELSGKMLRQGFDEFIGQFASDEAQFKAIVDEMKKSLPAEPPKSMADFKGVAVEPNAPSVAKFANLGPEQGEMAAKFAAQYREMKRLKWPTQQTEEQFVKFQMEAATGLSA